MVIKSKCHCSMLMHCLKDEFVQESFLPGINLIHEIQPFKDCKATAVIPCRPMELKSCSNPLNKQKVS